jgi:hypothetical protein
MVLTGPTTRPSESGHWYDRDGTPRYDVRAKDGTMRPATLRDARKFGWYPGVTSIIKCAAAPGLDRWKEEQAILAALTLPRVAGESNEALLARIRADAGEQARKARERGTEIHAAIQGHYEGTPPDVDLLEYVHGVTESLRANFGEQQWITEEPCAHPLGFGTKADLRCAVILNDFKGSEFTKADMGELKTWDEHHMQLAATREALHHKHPGLRIEECAITYVSRTVPGLCRPIRVDEEDLQRGWDMFRGLLNYWKAKNKYWPELWSAKVAA